MNRREFLAILSAAGISTSPRRLAGFQSRFAEDLSAGPIRRQFLEARARAEFWLGLDQLAEPLPYLRQAWELGAQCGTIEEKAEILQKLKDCEVQLELSRDFVQCNKHLISEDLSTLKWYWLVGRDLQKIGRHWEAIEIFSQAIAKFPRIGLDEKGLFQVARAHSRYCTGDHEEVLREVHEAIAEIPDGQTAVTPLLLECEILSLCALDCVDRAEMAVRAYAARFGRLPAPHRYALHDLGVDSDSIFLKEVQA